MGDGKDICIAALLLLWVGGTVASRMVTGTRSAWVQYVLVWQAMEGGGGTCNQTPSFHQCCCNNAPFHENSIRQFGHFTQHTPSAVNARHHLDAATHANANARNRTHAMAEPPLAIRLALDRHWDELVRLVRGPDGEARAMEREREVYGFLPLHVAA